MDTLIVDHVDTNLDGRSPFSLAVAWCRLFNAEMALADVDGREGPTTSAVRDLRSRIWDRLHDSVDAFGREDVMARARVYVDQFDRFGR